MRILGIDPGSSRIGFGLIEKRRGSLSLVEVGVIEIPKGSASAKLLGLGTEFKKMLARTKPDMIGIEKIFFSKNAKTAIGVAEARGLIAYCSLEYLGRNGSASAIRELVECTPQEAKVAVTNWGGADKKAVARMVSLILKAGPLALLDDATDALAIAICAANRNYLDSS